MIEPTIRPEYLDAHFLADPFPKKWPNHFIIITAYNPDGEIVNDGENNRRHESLRNALGKLGISFFDIIGCSPDTFHQEPGFGIESITVERAREIGRVYQQNAVFEIYGDRLFVVGCALGDRLKAGSFPERLIYPGADVLGGRNNPILIELNAKQGLNAMMDDRFGKDSWTKTREFTERDDWQDAFFCWDIELFNGSREVVWFKRNYTQIFRGIHITPAKRIQ
jgi:hypothetical protein